MGRDVREVVAVLSSPRPQRCTLELGLTASIRGRVTRASLEGAVNMPVRGFPSAPAAEVSVCAESALPLRCPAPRRSAWVSSGAAVPTPRALPHARQLQ